MTAAILVASAGLIVLPALAWPLGRRLPPSHWKRLCVIALAAGWLGIELSLFLHAAPTLLRTIGGPSVDRLCEGMLGHLALRGPAAGWGATALFALSITAAGRTWRRARADLRRLRIEPDIGLHVLPAGESSELVVLPTSRPVAYSTCGWPAQVVVSTGVLAALDSEELALLIRHEEAHLRRRDQRLLTAITSVSTCWRWMPGLTASVGVTRVAIERAADEDATGPGLDKRRALANALVKTALGPAMEPAAAFSAADGLEERVIAMSDGVHRLPGVATAMFYATAGLLPLGVTGVLAWCAVQAERMLFMACMCVR